MRSFTPIVDRLPGALCDAAAGAPRLGNAAGNVGWRLLCCLAIFFIFTVASSQAFAQGAEIKQAKLELNEEGYQLSAEFELQLLAVHEDAIRKGVPIYIEIEVEVSRSRWYWLDERVVRQTRERRISYSPIANQFRISTAGLSQNLPKFEDVKRALSTVRSWQILERGKLRPGERYDVAVRIRLDATQLPKPLQLNVLGAREWDIASPWARFSIVGGESK